MGKMFIAILFTTAPFNYYKWTKDDSKEESPNIPNFFISVFQTITFETLELIIELHIVVSN